jgi:hypothetical protein
MADLEHVSQVPRPVLRQRPTPDQELARGRGREVDDDSFPASQDRYEPSRWFTRADEDNPIPLDDIHC